MENGISPEPELLQVQHYTFTCQHRQDCSHILDFFPTQYCNYLLLLILNTSDYSVKKFIYKRPAKSGLVQANRATVSIGEPEQQSVSPQEPPHIGAAFIYRDRRPARRISPNTSSSWRSHPAAEEEGGATGAKRTR